ncbi:MAG: ATP-binding protein [candidate division WOR-3 bacterium]
MKEYVRQELYDALYIRLKREPRLLQAIIGPRQVGKTTLVLQVLDKWHGPKLYMSADLPTIPTIDWIIACWNEARTLEKKRKKETLLVLDEIQKIPRWSEVVKKLFDEDKIAKRKLRTVVLGSSSLLVQKGLTESLAGRFEIHRHYHWSFKECKEYFKLSLPEYIYFGGFPGALPLRKDENRWAKYVRDSLIETVISKDVILMSPITKPALLRQTFGLCLGHPAEIISYQKMIGQLQDAGNTTTIAYYLRLLNSAFLLAPLEKYSGSVIKQRGSTPKILVLDNALISATYGKGYKNTLKDKKFWGRLLENAVGAKLFQILQEQGGELLYWRDRNDEVDYVVRFKNQIIAIEIKSRGSPKSLTGLNRFIRRYPNAEKVILQPEMSVKTKEVSETPPTKFIALNEFFLNPTIVIKN